MKNEPVVSYDHMRDETAMRAENHSRHSFNLYLLFAVDVMVISAIIFAAIKIIFWVPSVCGLNGPLPGGPFSFLYLFESVLIGAIGGKKGVVTDCTDIHG